MFFFFFFLLRQTLIAYLGFFSTGFCGQWCCLPRVEQSVWLFARGCRSPNKVVCLPKSNKIIIKNENNNLTKVDVGFRQDTKPSILCEGLVLDPFVHHNLIPKLPPTADIDTCFWPQQSKEIVGGVHGEQLPTQPADREHVYIYNISSELCSLCLCVGTAGLHYECISMLTCSQQNTNTLVLSRFNIYHADNHRY